MVEREQQFDSGTRESLPLPSERPLSEEWVFFDGDRGCWWLSLAEDRALVAAARRDPTPNPQLLLIVVFLHRSTRRHEWLYPLKLKIMPGLQAEQHSGNCRRVRRCVEVNPPDGCTSTKEEGGGASSGQGTVVVMLATALSSPTAGGWPSSTLVALLRPSPLAAAAAALGMSMHMCWHKGGAGRGGCGGGGVLWCHMTELILSPTFPCLV